MDVSSLMTSLPTSSDEPITLSSLNSLIQSCPDTTLLPAVAKAEHLLLSSSNNSAASEQEAGYVSLCRALIGRCSLPLAADDISPVAETEYCSLKPRVRAVSRSLIALLRILGKSAGAGGGADDGGGGDRILLTVAPDVCVFAVTHFQVAPWSSPSSRSDAQEVMRALLEAGSWTDSAHLLLGDREQKEGGVKGILGPVLDLLQPQLNKESAFRCDAVKLVFSWTLLQVTQPHLSPHLTRLLPPSLLLTDHYRPENCMLGVRCLHHIILHTACADLRQLNRAEVVYEAVFRLLYSGQPQIIQCVLSCLLDLLLVLEKPPSYPSPSPSIRSITRHDAVLRLVLTQMEAEHKLALRRVYASALPPLVERCGISVCRHMKRLERVILGYLELTDPPDETSRIQTLLTLQQVLKNAWPRADQSRRERFLTALLRLLVDVSSLPQIQDSVRHEVLVQSGSCIRLLDTCSHGTLQPLLLQVDSSHCSPQIVQLLHSLTAQTPT